MVFIMENTLVAALAVPMAFTAPMAFDNTQILLVFGKILSKMTDVIDLLASFNRAVLLLRLWGTLHIIMVLSAPVTHFICSRYIIKRGYYHRTAHLCVKTLLDNAYYYCTSQHTKYKTVRDLFSF